MRSTRTVTCSPTFDSEPMRTTRRMFVEVPPSPRSFTARPCNHRTPSEEHQATESCAVLNPVARLNHTILEAFDGVQVQGHVTMTPRYQGNAIPNEHWRHGDDELVDRLLVKKGGDEPAATHQPDILARPLSKTAHEWADCTVHELDA